MNMCVNVSPSSYVRLRMIILWLFEFAKKGVKKLIFCVCDCGKSWRQNQSYGNVWLALVRCFLIRLIGDLVLRNKVILLFWAIDWSRNEIHPTFVLFWKLKKLTITTGRISTLSLCVASSVICLLSSLLLHSSCIVCILLLIL